MKAVRLFTLLLVLAISGEALAQDIHFSQFYNSPLTLNPALTGKTQGSYRIGVNYRNQWFGPINGTTTFSTIALFGDVPIRLDNGDIVGVGGYLFNDQSSGGRLSNLTFMVSGAYHKALGKNNAHAISLGVQAGYVRKQLDMLDITFGDQINLQDNTTPITSAESFDDNTGNFDLNVGLAWSSAFGDKVIVHAGAGIFHVLTPEQAFTETNGTNFDQPMRISVNGGADFRVGENVSLIPSVIFMQQRNVHQLNAGAAVAYDFNPRTTLMLGAYYRAVDAGAMIPYFGFEIAGMKLGLSYDAQMSDLTNTNGSVELSLIYTGRYVAVSSVEPSLYCPRF